jgi:hypothetical protein
MQFDQFQRREFITLFGGAEATGRSRSLGNAKPYESHGSEQSLGELPSRALSGICSATLEKTA